MRINTSYNNILLFLFIFAISFQNLGQNQNWSAFKDIKGKFEIITPISSTLKTYTVKSEYGIIESKSFSIFSESNKNQYLFAYADYPLKESDNIDNFFNSRILGSVENIHGKLLNEEVINYKNYPGRKIRVLWNNGELVNNVVFYLINNRLYYLQVTTSVGDDFNTDIYKFLNSFKYLD
jgi:hypothetical protein